MLVSTRAIILHNVKYADKKVISKMYTQDYGLISLNINVGNTTKSKIKPAIIFPLSQLEIELSLKENKEVHPLIEAKPFYIYQSLNQDFSKLCIAQFINEVLYKCLKEQQANKELFEFITQAFQWLDLRTENYNNFHIYFLFELTKYLGFKPINNKTLINKYFDVREGKFSPSLMSFPLGFDEHQSNLFHLLFNLSLSNLEIVTKSNRETILECLIAYYKMHLPGIHELKSYSILQETMKA
jgi:DNA repair protein RecO (recombination protein O)